MPYSQFKTIGQALDSFKLVLEERSFFPDIPPIAPSKTLTDYLKDTLPAVAVTGSEKARSEGIIYPVLTEVRRICKKEISLFSGEEFNVDPTLGLNGVCDFILSKSPRQLLIQAPVLMMAEAKRADLALGLGQCIAEMVAAQQFNQTKQVGIERVYGCVSSGTQWLFLQLEAQTVTIDLTEYPLPPLEPILGCLTWIVQPA